MIVVNWDRVEVYFTDGSLQGSVRDTATPTRRTTPTPDVSTAALWWTPTDWPSTADVWGTRLVTDSCLILVAVYSAMEYKYIEGQENLYACS